MTFQLLLVTVLLVVAFVAATRNKKFQEKFPQFIRYQWVLYAMAFVLFVRFFFSEMPWQAPIMFGLFAAAVVAYQHRQKTGDQLTPGAVVKYKNPAPDAKNKNQHYLVTAARKDSVDIVVIPAQVQKSTKNTDEDDDEEDTSDEPKFEYITKKCDELALVDHVSLLFRKRFRRKASQRKLMDRARALQKQIKKDRKNKKNDAA